MEAFKKYISLNPEIRFGKPCIKGTRITVSDILQWLASGMTYEEIMEDFPPKIVLLRTGNQSTREVADLLEKHKNQISKLETTDHLGILEIF